MDIKVISALLASCVISSSSFAFHITEANIISHKQWVTGSVKKMKVANITPTRSKDFFKEGDAFTYGSVFLAIPDVTSNAGDYVDVSGTADMFMMNATDTDKTYRVMTAVCTTSVTSCASSEETVLIQPQDGVFLARKITATIMPTDAGSTKTFVFSAIMDGEDGVSSATYTAATSGKLDVNS